MTPAEMKAINPLIDSDGNTYCVSSALTAISAMLEGGQTFDDAQGFGLSMILQTCAAALRRMGEINHE